MRPRPLTGARRWGGGKVSAPEEVETSLQGSSNPIDFLLIDAEHPVDSDRALHAAARAREIRPGIGVLLTSTHANGDTLKRSLAERDWPAYAFP